MKSEKPIEYKPKGIFAPLEYKRGYTKFLNCKIDLRNRVFIPRIETEFWVKKAIDELKIENCKLKILESPVVEKQRAEGKRQKPKVSGARVGGLLILDIFAGSGCIGIAILKACPELCRRVDFVDNDKKAIEQIKINLKINKVPQNRYKIYQSNLFEKLEGKKYDYIFANPPYVAKERLNEVQISVKKYEPKEAWFGGEKGLKIISKFLKEAKNFLKKDGTIYFEFDPLQKKEIGKIFKKEDFKIQFLKDQFGKFRYAKIEKKINIFEKLYKELKRKYGYPKDQWELWCKRPKTKREREEVIIGAILTQRTNWKNVELAMNNLKKAKINSLPSRRILAKFSKGKLKIAKRAKISLLGLKDIYRLGERSLAHLIKPSGFYRAKASYLFLLSKFILKNYGDLEKMKKTNLLRLREQLLKQKGIGPETADSILLYALDKPVFVIDEYTRRLVKNRGLTKKFSYQSLQKLFEKKLKKDFKLYQDLHALIVINEKNKKYAAKRKRIFYRH